MEREDLAHVFKVNLGWEGPWRGRDGAKQPKRRVPFALDTDKRRTIRDNCGHLRPSNSVTDKQWLCS